ncbi:hypothetical protein HanHA300_Chr16g0593171 [Helianthus annuus]|nr:hypothetical protein HanHA300_Chr16g0593171 [Helianthus annuus]KAJ0639489.1 hypothetical protein HanLR1_Chr16g0604451 [Helianthus annuus]
MATYHPTSSVKPQGSRCKRFEFWTKVAKVTKPQGPKWQFTQRIIIIIKDLPLQ